MRAYSTEVINKNNQKERTLTPHLQFSQLFSKDTWHKDMCIIHPLQGINSLFESSTHHGKAVIAKVKMADSYKICKAMEATSCLKAKDHTLRSSMVSKQEEDFEEINLWQDCQEAAEELIRQKQWDPPFGVYHPPQVRCKASTDVEQKGGGVSLTRGTWDLIFWTPSFSSIHQLQNMSSTKLCQKAEISITSNYTTQLKISSAPNSQKKTLLQLPHLKSIFPWQLRRLASPLATLNHFKGIYM